MKKLLLLLLAAAAFSGAQAQNVNGLLFDATNTGTRDASAAFEINANTNTPGSPLYGGLLPPRVALTGTTDVATIAGTEANGLLVFNTVSVSDVTPGFYFWSTTAAAWQRIQTGATSVAGNDIDFGTSATGSIDVEPILNFVHTINAPAANNLNLIPPAGFKVTVNNLNPGTTGVNEVFSVYNGAGGASPTFYLTPSGRAIANDWYYSAGNTGWFNSAWGGGWYMDNATHVKSYGDKSVYIVGTANTLRIDGLKAGSTFNSGSTATTSTLLYSNNSTGDIYALPTVNSATLTTGATGIPAWTVPSTTTVGFNSWTKATTATTAAIKTDNQYVTGKVGVGDFSAIAPPQNLSVVGVISVGEAASNGDRLRFSADGTSAIINYTNNAPLITQVNAAERMRIDLNGNVGIANTSPTAKLSVGAADLTGAAMSTIFKTNAGALGGTATNESVLASIGYTSANQTALGVRAYRSTTGADWQTSAILLEMDVDATPRVNNAYISINANGSIGIGTIPTANTYKLNVSGGKLLTAGIDENSDARFKHNINPIYDALSKVTQMRGVTYNWRTEEFPERNFEKDMQFGLIAQELEKVIPELVTTDGDGYKAIEYSHLVPVLIEAIKELEAKNNAQQTTINSQQQTNSELKASLENLLIRMNALENTVEVKTNKAEK